MADGSGSTGDPGLRLPDLGRRGEGYTGLQAVLLLVVAGSALLGPGWSGAARVVSAAVGAILVVAGGWLVIRGVVDLRENLTVFPRPRDDNRLIESGAYRFVRHPIYGGQLIGSLGLSLVAASPATLLATMALGVLYLVKSAREERWLVERHPDYVAYRDRTRRFIPWLF